MNLYWPHKNHFRSPEAKRERRLAKWRQAEAAAKDVLVVSHGNCLDGVTSAVIAQRVLGPDRVGVAYAQPDRMLDTLRFFSRFDGNGRTFMVADLSLNPDQYDGIVNACRAMAEKGWRLEWRDHHHKQWEGLDLDRLRRHVNVLTVNDDGTESGASLQQKALAEGDDLLAALADKVRDRDCWINEDPDGATLEMAMSRMGARGFAKHLLTTKEPVDDSVRKAAAEQERIQQRAGDKILRHARHFTAPNGRKIAVAYGWLPKNVGLHRLIEEGADVAINVRPNARMSIRSRKGCDVSHLIARRFSGGGHPNASGGNLQLDGAKFWWYVLRRGRVARVQEVVDAAIEEVSR